MLLLLGRMDNRAHAEDLPLKRNKMMQIDNNNFILVQLLQNRKSDKKASAFGLVDIQN